MATVTPERRVNWKDTDRRVRHPLQAVRGYIRQYVILEGLGQTLLFLSVAFWLGLVFDWGLFSLTGIDWIQTLQELTNYSSLDIYVRGLILTLVVLGLLAVAVTRTLLRLFGEFSDPAMAMLLERRFPRELGDRLITAVELADPRQGERYGFSLPLIEKTIRDAADRVEQVPVKGVFNWARLRWIYVMCLLATVGVYAVVGAAYCGSRGELVPVKFVNAFNDTGGLWFDRNVALRDIHWPRQAFLEVIGFKGSAGSPNEMRVGSGEEREPLRVRAVKWIKLAMRRSLTNDEGDTVTVPVPGGWAPLMYKDLHDLLSEEERAKFKIDLPANWDGWALDPDDDRGDWQEWTVDQLWRQFKDTKVRVKMDVVAAGCNSHMQQLFQHLTELADEPGNGRRIRELSVPEEAIVYAVSNSKPEKKPLLLGEENMKCEIGFSSVTYTTTFRVNALDYFTPTMTIAVIPPPSLLSLTADRLEPAYVYYRLAGGDQRPLKGQKHVTIGEQLALTDISKVKVARGADVVLRAEIAEVQKGKLKDVTLRRIRDKDRLEGEKNDEKAALPNVQPVLDDDKAKFTIAIKNVATTYDFVIEFRDENNALGQRRVRIEIQSDRPPEAFVEIESEKQMRLPRMRGKTSKTVPAIVADAYLITPDARLPLRARLSDDYGLTDANWITRLEQVDVEFFETPRDSSKDKDPKTGKDNKVGKDLKQPAKVVKNIIERKLALRDVTGYNYAGKPVNGPFREWEIDQDKRAITLEQIHALNQAERDSAAIVLLFNQSKYQDALPLARALLARRQKILSHNDVDDHVDVARSLRLVSDILEAQKDDAGAAEYRRKAVEIDQKRRGALLEWDGYKNPVSDFKLTQLARLVPNLKASDSQPQLHYLLNLSLEATDNNVETGPITAEGSSRVKFIIVSAAEFLAQIGEDEGPLSKKLEDAYTHLAASRSRLQEQYQNLSSPSATYEDIRGRVELTQMELDLSAALTKEVLSDYDNIRRSLLFNREEREAPFSAPIGVGPVHEKFLRVENKIVNPLKRLVEGQPLRIRDENGNSMLNPLALPPKVDFPTTELAVKRLFDTAKKEKDAGLKGAMPTDSLPGRQLAAGECRDQVTKLMEQLNKVTIEIQELVSLSSLGATVRRLADEQERRAKEWQQIYERKERDVLEDLLRDPPK